MATDTKQFRLITQLTDESFTVSKADTYNLYIAMSTVAIRFGIEDIVRNKFVLLEDYSLTAVFRPTQLVEQLRLLIVEHAFFSWLKWHKVRASVKNQKFTFLPGTLFSAESHNEYLQLHAEIDDFHDQVWTYHHESLDMVNIFASDRYLPDMLHQLFTPEKLQLRHQTSGLIEAMLHQSERVQQKKMYLFVELSYFTIIIIKENTREFCNVFY